jgi:hypothetical protein
MANDSQKPKYHVPYLGRAGTSMRVTRDIAGRFNQTIPRFLTAVETRSLGLAIERNETVTGAPALAVLPPCLPACLPACGPPI